MTAAKDCANVTIILLILPATYLQNGQAADSATLSFRLGDLQGDCLLFILLVDTFVFKDQSLGLSGIFT